MTGGGGGGATAGGASIFGLHSGAKSPPCLDFTAMSSAISYCNCRRSSLNFPTSANSILTSLAKALVKSFIYLGVAGGYPGGCLAIFYDIQRKAAIILGS